MQIEGSPGPWRQIFQRQNYFDCPFFTKILNPALFEREFIFFMTNIWLKFKFTSITDSKKFINVKLIFMNFYIASDLGFQRLASLAL